MQRWRGGEPGLEDLRRLVDATGEGLAMIEGDRVAWANAGLMRLVGAAAGVQLAGRRLGHFVRFASGEPGLDRGVPRRARLTRLDGTERAVLVGALGTPGEGVWTLRVVDLEHRQALEAEVARTGRELHDARRELGSLRERIRSEAAAREELLTVVSHELRTPCTVIQGYNRLLLSGRVGEISERQRHFLEESQKSCQRLNAFIGNLLEAARQGLSVGPLEVCDAPIPPLVEGVMRQLEPLLDEHRLRIEATFDSNAPSARCDPRRIEQVLLNLLGNALKFAPAGSVVEIVSRAVVEDGRRFVELAVLDAGAGVEPADRDRIFEPYVQAGESRKAGGLGLGLAICRGIVQAHGGRIRVDPRPGGGSRFSFTLPATEASGRNAARDPERDAAA